jgi:rhomboid family GlyGly-CTERM serine protease
MDPAAALALVYHRQAFLDGQWWLPFTAQLAHFNIPHALANLAGALLLAALFHPWLRWRQQVWALAGGVVGVAVVVVADAQCTYYAGASGALHGWAAGGAMLLLAAARARPGTVNRVGPAGVAAVLLLGLCAKLAWQGASAVSPWASGFPVYAPAHWGGALGGVVLSALALRLEPALAAGSRLRARS